MRALASLVARIAPLPVLLVACAGCGGGAALMHPAHTLVAKQFCFGAGISNQFVLGDASAAMQRARDQSTPAGMRSAQRADLTRGAMAFVMLAPGLSPWLGARAGLGYDSDVGFTYTGRAARFDGRYAFQNESFALSLGGGISAIADRPDRVGALGTSGSERIDNLSSGATHGFGADIPVLVGWRSSASLVQAWAGARAGFETLRGQLRFRSAPELEERASIEARRWYTGGLVGLSVGVRPFWIALELDVNYQHAAGEVRGTFVQNANVNGVSMAPTGAILARF